MEDSIKNTTKSSSTGGRPALELTEKLIRYAMANTWSNTEAAKFLGVNYKTYRWYAKLYREPDGRTLFEVHKKVSFDPERMRNIRKKKSDKSYSCNKGYKEKLEDILAGKHQGYSPRKLRKRILLSGWIEPICANCAWNESRVTDGNYPLLINFKDTNWRNCHQDNIELLCFNCYFLLVRSPSRSFQGWSYGKFRKQVRADGKPKGYGSRRWNKEHGVTESYRVRRYKQLLELNEEYRIKYGEDAVIKDIRVPWEISGYPEGKEKDTNVDGTPI